MADGAQDSKELSDASGSKTGDGDKKETSWLQNFMVSALHISATPPEKLLPEVTIEGVAKYILSDKCNNVVTIAGAGISTSAGIPDFRSPESGLYHNLQKYNLPDPQAIFAIDYFKENPEPFFMLAKELFPGHFKPTPCHYFIKMLHDKGKLLRHYTQNIDTLERVSGLDGDKLVEAHGTFHTSHCLICGKEFTQDWIKDKIFTDTVPKCDQPDCDGVVKPDIVFFGEKLPDRFAECVTDDMNKCDMLIVMGTSLVVQPFASLTARVPVTTPRLYINLEKGMTGMDPFAALFFGGGGFDFDGENNYRDVFKESTCDDGCYALAGLLGWGPELKKLVATEHAKIDKEITKEASKATAKKTPLKMQSKTSKKKSP
ncbi:NAD-dependent protein deacetylase sirtuin-2-like isoform X2 [Gigantopelta aegis]|uniref:NAD-dependent protein deacetylase sirtuin-2-like isoform X2 n=1 Tax=Gigantopelta aegis TaxID=1735272 RepID=UPI001B88C363|nr:NAD-dependent protein deacetylase sirtuin-2-like isoform X2 [Gigantopelta aegis]XP_041352850.1 NAD-dependent protein deacetylase sirtuin-2-like isoform X2 [Gigantopelta aegis]